MCFPRAHEDGARVGEGFVIAVAAVRGFQTKAEGWRFMDAREFEIGCGEDFAEPP